MKELDQVLKSEQNQALNLLPMGTSFSLAVKEEVMKCFAKAAALKKRQFIQAHSLEMWAQMNHTWRMDQLLPTFLTMLEASLTVQSQFLLGEVFFQQVVIVYWSAIAGVIIAAVIQAIQLVKN